ncbi:8020_t:CDS:2 [Rhizophagus irregularis]|nr:8020_t:CDS:2 [Rhizophagus irregularis]
MTLPTSSFNNFNNSNNAELLASALTSLTGSKVITQTEYLNLASSNGNNATYQNINLLSLHNSHLVSTSQQNNENLSCLYNYYILQETQQFIYFSNSQFISTYSPNLPITAKISFIKFYIENKTRIPSNKQRLIYSGNHLKDNLTLLDYNILDNNSIIYLIGQIFGDVISFIDSDFLDPMYDCDFTNINDNNKRFMRGSHEYRRPCGWKRIAVKVLNKYEDNYWLGKAAKKGTWRYESDPMEWPVSYHGTNKFNAKSIAETGFDVTKGKRFKFGHGIYSTPDINIAALYANTFIHNNEEYCLVFQNRVNPKTLIRIPTNIGEYWISPNSEDIRPYGICIKKLLPRN